jgi:hypothetical protein
MTSSRFTVYSALWRRNEPRRIAARKWELSVKNGLGSDAQTKPYPQRWCTPLATRAGWRKLRGWMSPRSWVSHRMFGQAMAASARRRCRSRRPKRKCASSVATSGRFDRTRSVARRPVTQRRSAPRVLICECYTVGLGPAPSQRHWKVEAVPRYLCAVC